MFWGGPSSFQFLMYSDFLTYKHSMTLEEYFSARDLWTGETFAEYCDRCRISFESAMFGFDRAQALEQIRADRRSLGQTTTRPDEGPQPPQGPVPA